MNEQELLTPEEVKKWRRLSEMPVWLETEKDRRVCHHCRDYLTLHDLLENAKEEWAEHELTCSDLYYERTTRHD